MNKLYPYNFIITIFISILFINPIYSQDSNIEIGIEGGPSLTFFRGESNQTRFSDPSFTSVLGVTFQKNFSKTFSLRTGLAYENKGAIIQDVFTNDTGSPIGSYESRFSYHYLNIPLLAKLSFGNKTKFFLNGGPFLGYLIKRTFSYPLISVGKEAPITSTIDNTKYSKRIDLGLSGGLGLSFSLGKKVNLNTELRYNYGLINTNSSLVNRNQITKTNSVNFLIGLLFKLGTNQE